MKSPDEALRGTATLASAEGCDTEMVEQLGSGSANHAEVIRKTGIDVESVPGAGAAGGL